MGPDLVELRVRNLGVIDDVTVALGPGMTALTGETGAGKTLLVEAIGLLLGGRADPSVVRAGADEAMVEGRFVVPDRRGRPTDETAGGATVARSFWPGRWSAAAAPRRGSTAGWPPSAPWPRPPPA